jgi:hypothetical protein
VNFVWSSGEWLISVLGAAFAYMRLQVEQLPRMSSCSPTIVVHISWKIEMQDCFALTRGPHAIPKTCI